MTSKLQINNHHDAAVISKALQRAADYWGINNRILGGIIGLSEATISRLRHNQYLLDQHSKQWQMSLIFLRIFRGLDAFMGGNIANEKEWLRADNIALGGIPIEMMQNPEGLVTVVQYIDYMRGQ